MIQQLGRLPTLVELTDSLKWKPELVAFLAQVSQKNVSLDALVGNYEDTSMVDLMPSELPTPEEFVEARLQTEIIQECLDKLPNKEREVLELRCGLNGREPMTFSAVANTLEMSRERIRQLENQGKKRLVAIAKKKAPEPELGQLHQTGCVSAADGLRLQFPVSDRKIS